MGVYRRFWVEGFEIRATLGLSFSESGEMETAVSNVGELTDGYQM